MATGRKSGAYKRRMAAWMASPEGREWSRELDALMARRDCAVRAGMRTRGGAPTPDEHEAMLLYRDGLSMRAVARRLGRSVSFVCRVVAPIARPTPYGKRHTPERGKPAAALQMREAGASWAEIAHACEYANVNTAQVAVSNHKARLAKKEA